MICQLLYIARNAYSNRRLCGFVTSSKIWEIQSIHWIPNFQKANRIFFHITSNSIHIDWYIHVFFLKQKEEQNVIIPESTMTFQYSIRLIIIELNTKTKWNETKKKKTKKSPIQFWLQIKACKSWNHSSWILILFVINIWTEIKRINLKKKQTFFRAMLPHLTRCLIESLINLILISGILN